MFYFIITHLASAMYGFHFDVCSACDVDGLLLLELNRMLRAGGYFAWAAQPVYKHEEAQQEAWTGTLKIAYEC